MEFASQVNSDVYGNMLCCTPEVEGALFSGVCEPSKQ